MKTFITILLFALSLIGNAQSQRMEYFSDQTAFISYDKQHREDIEQDVTIVIDEGLMIIKVTRGDYETFVYKITSMEWREVSKTMMYILHDNIYQAMYVSMKDDNDHKIMFLPFDDKSKTVFYFNIKAL